MNRIYTLIFLLVSASILAQSSLPRSQPEAEGVSSAQIVKFLDAADASDHEFHSLMVVRHGKVVAEGWWAPYAADIKHTMYSVSKSFTATAVGYAVSEKKLSVNDPVISYFPDEAPASIDPNLKSLRIKDLLSMSVGQKPDPTGPVVVTSNWARTFLNIPIIDPPGTKFLYNSAGTYMLSAIVKKATGQTAFDYLEPRLFKPLGIEGIDWEVSPQGANTGGWGLRLKTEDMAKFGQLFLQKGIWNGKQVLPAEWVAEASSMKIMQDPDAPPSVKDSSDWLQGYCYQMWRSRHNSYRGDGAFGQFILVLPELDAVVILTAETSDMQGELNLVWKYLLPAFHEKKLSTDKKAYQQLKLRLASLALPLDQSMPNPSLERQLANKAYAVVSPDRRLQGFEVAFKDGNCHLTLHTDSIDHAFDFGAGKWMKGETTKLGPYLVAAAQSNRTGLAPFKTRGSYAWTDDHTATFTLRYIESPHTETISMTVSDSSVSLTFGNSFNKASTTFKAVPKVTRPNAPRLVVRGDDMGFSHAADVALIKSYRQGIETSIEVIAPSPWFPETVELLKQNPRVDVGLHFAITSEWDNVKWRPISDCPSLKNSDGYFYQMLFKNKYYPGQAVMDHDYQLMDIEKEFRAQIEMARKYLPQLSHVSGHMGSTGFAPEVKDLLEKLSAEYHVPIVDSRMGHSMNYVGFPFKGKSTEERIEAFINMLDHLEDGKTYVFVEHPGLNDPELQAIHHIGNEDVAQARQDVTTIFTSEQVKEAIIRKGIELVSYAEVLK